MATILEIQGSIISGKPKEKTMEEQEFLVNQTKQIAVKAINHDEAIKKVINGEGKVASMGMSVNPRPQGQSLTPNSGIRTSGVHQQTTTVPTLTK